MNPKLFKGLLLKLMGLGAKAVFVFVFASQLGEGEFSSYFLLFTYALLGARVLAMGADNFIAFLVKGSLRRSRYYLAVSNLYACCAAVFVGVSYFFDVSVSKYLLCVALIFALSSSSYQIGALRSHDNAFQERRANLPWLLVCVLIMLFGASTASNIFQYLVFSYLFVGLIDLRKIRSLGIGRAGWAYRPIVRHARRWKRWLPVALSSVGVAASLRSFPIILDLFGFVVSDSLAFNFVVGEIIYQVCMVYVNQVQSLVARRRQVLRVGSLHKVVAVFIGASLLMVAGVSVLRLLVNLQLLEQLAPQFLLAVSLYCATVAMFSFVSVFAWGSRSALLSTVVLGFQFASFLLCGLAIIVLGMGIPAVLSVGLINVLLVYWIYFYLRSKD